MKTIIKTTVYETYNGVLVIESISYEGLLWVILWLKNTTFLIKSKSYDGLLCYYGFSLKVLYYASLNPNNFLDTPPL